MVHRRINRTDWIVWIVLFLLTVFGYYFDVLGPPEAGGYVVRVACERGETDVAGASATSCSCGGMGSSLAGDGSNDRFASPRRPYHRRTRPVQIDAPKKAQAEVFFGF